MNILPMNLRTIVLSMASDVRRQYLTPHNIMVWPKESIEPSWRKLDVSLKWLNCLSHFGDEVVQTMCYLI